MTNTLSHYGVKGMKWGVRRRSSGSQTPQPTSKQIKFARKELASARALEARKQTTLRGKASIRLLGERSGRLSLKYRTMPARKIAYNMTNYDKALHTTMAIVSFGGTLPVTAISEVGRRRVIKDYESAVNENKVKSRK